MAATAAQEYAERMRSRITTPVNSAEKRAPGHAGMPSDPRAAIVVAAVGAKFAPSALCGWPVVVGDLLVGEGKQDRDRPEPACVGRHRHAAPLRLLQPCRDDRPHRLGRSRDLD
jgi:hypothetical protein